VRGVQRDDVAALVRHIADWVAVLAGLSVGGAAVDTALECPDLVRA